MAKKAKNNDQETLDQDVKLEEMENGVDNNNEGDVEANESAETPENEEDAVQKELEELRAQVSELKDKNLRLLAEFENFRKRTVREKLEMMKNAAQDTLAALLPVLDDFDRAKKTAEDDNSVEQFSEGVTLVYNKLYGVLKNRGLEPMESNGLAFDPELHEALTEIPAPTPEMKGNIVDTIEKGYTLNDKIIRHAKVVVGK